MLGSSLAFAYVSWAYTLPNLLVSPFAGALVDRWSRRRVMIMSDTGAGLRTLSIAVLYPTGDMAVWHVLIATAFNAAFSTFQLGYLASIAGLGMVVGTLIMSVWVGPRRRIPGVLGFLALGGLIVSLLGLRPQIPLMAFAGFSMMFTMPTVNGSSQAIWQCKVSPDVQGRVFAVRRVIARSTMPLAYLIAGPLADRIFRPLLMEVGASANSVGAVMGAGPGGAPGLCSF